jgi:hypothetical protein
MFLQLYLFVYYFPHFCLSLCLFLPFPFLPLSLYLFLSYLLSINSSFENSLSFFFLCLCFSYLLFPVMSAFYSPSLPFPLTLHHPLSFSFCLDLTRVSICFSFLISFLLSLSPSSSYLYSYYYFRLPFFSFKSDTSLGPSTYTRRHKEM